MDKPIITVKLSLEFEVEYDSFQGRTPLEFADIIDDDLHRALHDFREDDVKGIFSKVESVDTSLLAS